MLGIYYPLRGWTSAVMRGCFCFRKSDLKERTVCSNYKSSVWENRPNIILANGRWRRFISFTSCLAFVLIMKSSMIFGEKEQENVISPESLNPCCSVFSVSWTLLGWLGFWALVITEDWSGDFLCLVFNHIMEVLRIYRYFVRIDVFKDSFSVSGLNIEGTVVSRFVRHSPM